jgi:hypothetical protein
LIGCGVQSTKRVSHLVFESSDMGFDGLLSCSSAEISVPLLLFNAERSIGLTYAMRENTQLLLSCDRVRYSRVL